MSTKNRLIERLVAFLRPAAAQHQEKRFLILSTTALGDTLWATPALRAVRTCFPASYLGVVTSEVGQEVLKHNRHIDELFVVRKSFGLIPLYFRLKARRITHVISFHTSQRLILPLGASVAHEVIGSYGMNKGLDNLLTQALDHGEVHEIQRRLDLVARVGAHSLNPALELCVSPEDEKEAQLVIEGLALPPYLPLIALHPGSKDVFKRWSAPHFIELGRRLVQERGCQILVTGTRGERELVERIVSGIPSAVGVSHLPLRSLAALLKRAALLVSNDTGIMHVGFSQKTPTLGLFAPTNPTLCGPYFAPHAVAVGKPPTCTPCLKKRCQEPFCLLQIGVDEVYSNALTLLDTK